MRLEFTHSDLMDSSEYYNQFIKPIYEISKHYASDDYYIKAFCYEMAFTTITTYNRVICNLFKEGTYLVGIQLIRMQIDILTTLFADTLHPFNVLYKIYFKGKGLGKIRLNQKYLNPSDLRNKVDAEFRTNVSDLYKQYSSFNHPTKKQFGWEVFCAYSGNYEHYIKDLVSINQTIGHILSSFIETNNQHSD